MRVPTEGDQPSIMFIHLSCEYYTRLAVCVKRNLDFLIAPPRFELGQGEPKSPVLPLHQGANLTWVIIPYDPWMSTIIYLEIKKNRGDFSPRRQTNNLVLNHLRFVTELLIRPRVAPSSAVS